MLVLSRRLKEKIYFPSIGTVVQVLAMDGSTVRLGIIAPPEIIVLREELLSPVENMPLLDRPGKTALPENV